MDRRSLGWDCEEYTGNDPLINGYFGLEGRTGPHANSGAVSENPV